MQDLTARVDAWLSRQTDFSDASRAMQAAGLFEVAAGYRQIAHIKSLLVQRTGLLGLGSVWSGRQVVNRYFITGFGSPEQRAAWLGRPIAVAISEPGAGAHPKRLTTRAERAGDGFRISGEKAWVTNGPSAECFVVLAITAMEGDRKRFSAFLVPRDATGLTLKDMPAFHALRPSRHCGLVLDAVHVPQDAMLGEEGSAYEGIALPFRDLEDAVGVFGLLGALRFLLHAAGRTAPDDEQTSLLLGRWLAMAAVFEDAAEAVVAALDEGRLADKSATLVGLRLLAADMVGQMQQFLEARGLIRDPAIGEVLRDFATSLSVARGPRQVRQVRLAAELRHRAAPQA